MRRSMTLLSIAGLIVAAAGPLQAATLKIDYGVALAGLPIGSADLTGSFEGSQYKLQVQARLTGLAGAITGGKGGATAGGSVAGGRPLPASFAVTSRSSSDQRTVRMGLAGGNVVALDIAPPIVDDKPDRVPVSEAHKKGIVDPVSALVMPAVARGELTDPANCNRTIPVFDGAARFNVVLSYGETKQVDKPGYRGPVLVCNARYVPIAGHRAMRPATKFMEENRNMSVWLAPVEGSRVLVPFRIAVETMVGMSVIEVSRWTLSGTNGVRSQAAQN
jgi:hypothetical protein